MMNDNDPKVPGASDESAASPADSGYRQSPEAIPPAIREADGITAGSVPVDEVTTAAPPRAPQRSVLEAIFVGPNGIRAGWRLLIYFCLLAALSAVVRLVASRLFAQPQRGQSPRPGVLLLSELVAFVVAVIASLIMAQIEKEKWGDYGLPIRRAMSREFWFGCVWGFAALAAILGILRLAGAYHIDGVELTSGPAVKYAFLWGAMFLLVGLFEEFLLRGYLLYTLASGIWFWPAAVLTSSIFLFGHIHNPGENWYGLADVFVIGMFFCFTLWRTGDLWFAVGMHATWDWGQSYFFSVPDSGLVVPGHLLKMHMSGPAWLSGGSVGPEGSVVNLVADLLFFLLFALFYKQRRWEGMADRRRKRQTQLRGADAWAVGTGGASGEVPTLSPTADDKGGAPV